jgi:hypothetical protein
MFYAKTKEGRTIHADEEACNVILVVDNPGSEGDTQEHTMDPQQARDLIQSLTVAVQGLV